MADHFDPAPAAALLAETLHAGGLLTELPAAIRPTTMAEGYDVQDRLVTAIGVPIAGWKLGVGSAAQKREATDGRAIAGRILAPSLYFGGDTVPLPNDAPVTVEFEIAYVLGRDVLPDEPAYPPMEAVSETHVAFELVLSRFTDRRAVGWPSFAADNGGFQALVMGPIVDPAELEALAASLAVDWDGKEMARSLTGDALTDPAGSLADLFAIARERGMTLPKGSIISTGTLSKPFDVAAPTAAIRARFLGRELAFTMSAAPSVGLPRRDP